MCLCWVRFVHLVGWVCIFLCKQNLCLVYEGWVLRVEFWWLSFNVHKADIWAQPTLLALLLEYWPWKLVVMIWILLVATCFFASFNQVSLNIPLFINCNAHTCIFLQSRLLAVIAELGSGYPIANRDAPTVILKNSFAVVIERVNLSSLSDQTLSAMLGSNFNFKRIEYANFSLEQSSAATAAITLSAVLFMRLTATNEGRIVYSCFPNDALFLSRKEYVRQTGLTYQRLGSVVISAHVPNVLNTSNLEEPVQLTFVKNPVSLLLISKCNQHVVNMHLSCSSGLV